jgi:hypothetical protein
MGDKENVDCESLRNKWGMYDVGGRLYNSDGRDWGFYVDSLKKQYAEKGCGKDPLMEKCVERELVIQNLQNRISQLNQQNNTVESSAWFKVLQEETKKFSDLGCNAKIQESRNSVLGEKIDKYNELDKQRIEAESKYQAKKKIFIGASFILVAVALVLILKKE